MILNRRRELMAVMKVNGTGDRAESVSFLKLVCVEGVGGALPKVLKVLKELFNREWEEGRRGAGSLGPSESSRLRRRQVGGKKSASQEVGRG